MKNRISADNKLRAFALFTMAREHARKRDEFEVQMIKVLGVYDPGETYAGCLSDAISADADFEAAFANEGFYVLAE